MLQIVKQIGNIAIFNDSLSADPDQIIQCLHFSLAKLRAQFSVSLQRMLAHVGLTGNETADRLAKIGSQAPQTQKLVTYREAKTLLHFRFNGDWKNEKADTKHTLTQSGDWSGPSRLLSSACAQGTVVRVPM